MTHRLKAFLRLFLPAFFAFFLLQFVYSITVLEGFEYFMKALWYACQFAFIASIIPAVLFLILYGISLTLCRRFALTYFMLVLIIHFLLINYAWQTGILLGADLYGYSLDDITHTISASGSFSILPIVGLGVILGMFFYGVHYLKTDRVQLHKYFVFGYLLILGVALILPKAPNPDNFSNDALFIKIENPSTYFFTKSIDYWQGDLYVENTALESYPFLHTLDTQNPMGEWVNKGNELPNIVFITVEGLGADFVGAEAQYGGFTPFLDSLAEQSLYWSNCFSNTGRTFGVLPTMLGSLPYSKSGFMNMGMQMPEHQTLISLLKNQGYYSTFVYGGNANFDNQDIFLERQGVDYILEQSKFPKDYTKMTSNAEGFSWGYNDKDVFDFSLQKIKTLDEGSKLTFYMTLTTHEPFIVPQQEYVGKSDKISEKLNWTEEKLKVYNSYKGVFSCLNYTDDAIRQLIEGYKKLPDFENTIFIISGDHRLIPIPTNNALQRFHVPLIIYSPMLKKAIKSEQLVTHAQIAPTIMNYLHYTFGVAVPEEISFIANALPLETGFGSTLEIALMRNKNQTEEYISGLNLLSNGNLYRIDKQLELQRVDDPSMANTLKAKLSGFTRKSEQAMFNNGLIPESVNIKSSNTASLLSVFESKYIASNELGKVSPDTLLLKAKALVQKNDFPSSRIVLKYALTKAPNYHDLRVLLAHTYAWQNMFDSAYYQLDETLRRSEKYEDAYVAYADAAFWNAQYDLSSSKTEEGLSYYPESDELKARKARILIYNGKKKEGISLLNEILTISPNNELANNLLKQNIQ